MPRPVVLVDLDALGAVDTEYKGLRVACTMAALQARCSLRYVKHAAGAVPIQADDPGALDAFRGSLARYVQRGSMRIFAAI